MKNFLCSGIIFLISILDLCSQANNSIIPNQPSKASDYFCTWNIQGFVSNYESAEKSRMEMIESNMFGDGTYQNWLNFYPSIQKDLLFVMDDSWDIPISEKNVDGASYGLVELNEERFPSYRGDPATRLKKLVDAVKSEGWKGLGGWICAQEAPIAGDVDSKEYWIERLKDAHEAGFKYWKVDWGKNSHNLEWRKTMTNLGHIYAPNLIIEHAFNELPIKFSDVYRTYDVENVIAQPVTIKRISDLLKYKPQNNANGIINCEDEPYIAAGLGCAIGIMRHPFSGKLPNHKNDFTFPPVGRDIKHRLDEVIRGVRWHRIAIPFGVGSNNYSIDSLVLKDYWVLGERETWNEIHKPGDTLKAEAPARISRELPMARIINPSANSPFILSSKYPNGAIAIVTVGRGIDHEYIMKLVNVEQKIGSLDNPIGIFGNYNSLTLILPKKVKAKDYIVLAQDLAGDKPFVITNDIRFKKNKILIPGDIIRRVGLSAASIGDISEPGLVLNFKRKN